LPEAQRDELSRKFAAFVDDDPDGRNYLLVFRSGPGPNAFALPGGIVVVTDDMVKLAQSDEQLLAVLAHEIGHVRGRHALRLLLRQSGVFVLVTALAGDAVGMTILAAALPTVLLESNYSREFEADADDYAFDVLKRHGYSPQAFADVMRRLQAAEKSSGDDERFFRYLSSHPVTAERIERAEAAAR
jgi:predicted Zn-dependent protease